MSRENKVRVLVIDDEVTQRMLVKDYLDEAGYVVRQADDGKRGLKMATTTAPDLILLDVMLPSIDGYELCRSLKSHPTTADTPVILVTAARDRDAISKGLDAGADDFVTKPVDWDYLADRVGLVVRKSKERLEVAARIRDLEASAEKVRHEPPTEPALSEEASKQLHATYQEEISRLRLEAEEQVALLSQARAQIGDLEATAAKASEVGALNKTLAAEIDTLRNRMSADGERFVTHLTEARRSAVAEHAAEMIELRRRHDDERRATDAEIAALKAEMIEHSGRGNGGVAAWSLTLRSLDRQLAIANEISRLAAAEASSGASIGRTNLVELARLADANVAAVANARRFAHAAAEVDPPSMSHVDPVDLATAIVARSRDIADSGRVEVRLGMRPSRSAVIADEARLRCAWASLLVNAIKFTPPGGTVTVDVVAEDTGAVHLVVSDTGVGMSPTKLVEIVKCLDQPLQLASRPSESGGLGVPIAKALARQMGADVELESHQGRGTVASIVFPPSSVVVASPRQLAV